MTILVDRFELLEKIGEGGMGVVWRAYDRRLERDVAIKLLRPYLATEPDQRLRLAHEARTLAGLSHDHVVRVYDYLETDEHAFLVMELVEGSSLAAATFQRLPLSWSEAAWYAQPVCEALDYAHGKGVIHRDLTPANILIERESGRVVTTDFGLARVMQTSGSITAAGALVGTPEYWSPEQAMGRESGAPADLYALGCVLYLLLSGELPFDGDDRLAAGLRRAHEDAPSLGARAPQVPGPAIALVDSLLRRDPALRPDGRTTADALAHAARRRPLEVGWATSPATDARTAVVPSELPTRMAPGPSPTLRFDSKAPAPGRRRTRLLLLGALGAAATAAIAGVLLVDHVRGRAAEPPWLRHELAQGAALSSRLASVAGVGHPSRVVVPNLRDDDLGSALRTLSAKGLRHSVVYRRSVVASPNHVVAQRPTAGSSADRGTRVLLAVAREARWEKVFADSGSDAYASAPFTVSRRWRIRYRLDGGDGFLGPLTQFAWARDGDLFGYDGFLADNGDALQVHDVAEGAGTYRLSVRPYSPDTSWYVEVDALE
ncbi:MAG TPA: serine/threonine-protein kinase [Gaiellaceae bacterium]|nr:serine/threonine-protein kinase [Gaiellaceae bacterium]